MNFWWCVRKWLIQSFVKDPVLHSIQKRRTALLYRRNAYEFLIFQLFIFLESPWKPLNDLNKSSAPVQAQAQAQALIKIMYPSDQTVAQKAASVLDPVQVTEETIHICKLTVHAMPVKPVN